MNAVKTFQGKVIEDPKFAKFLTTDWRMSLLWLPIRIWVGYTWIDASLHKVSNPAWVVTGEALKGFWAGAVKIPDAPARPAITFEWYRSFIQMMLDAQAYTWFAKLVAYGELLIGIALILGAFTGIAAFVGGFMNWNFMMAGSASSNPLLFAAEVGLILAWKVAGLVGADFVLLRWLGTPWGRAQADKANQPVKEPAQAAAD
jgi:thiosulfate dehydrogenase (quinone) large subunit